MLLFMLLFLILFLLLLLFPVDLHLDQKGRALVPGDGRPAGGLVGLRPAPDPSHVGAVLLQGALQDLQDLVHLQASHRLGLDADVLRQHRAFDALVVESDKLQELRLLQTICRDLRPQTVHLLSLQRHVLQAFHKVTEGLLFDGVCTERLEELLPRLLGRGHVRADGCHSSGPQLLSLLLDLLFEGISCSFDLTQHLLRLRLQLAMLLNQSTNLSPEPLLGEVCQLLQPLQRAPQRRPHLLHLLLRLCVLWAELQRSLGLLQ
mmetsp:Transcript_95151/g.226509  ORF Transcript_95151/g.226509 Transcript_95151/m.226509 type:complete len:262 (-) Transcript_95151:683-1468(-)